MKTADDRFKLFWSEMVSSRLREGNQVPHGIEDVCRAFFVAGFQEAVTQGEIERLVASVNLKSHKAAEHDD